MGFFAHYGGFPVAGLLVCANGLSVYVYADRLDCNTKYTVRIY